MTLRHGTWLAALIGGSIAGLLLRLVLFAFGAVALHGLAQAAAMLLVVSPSLDPVYTRAALRSLADLHLQGLAVAGPVGAWLHTGLPALFAAPERVHWAPMRLVVEPGSPVLGRLVAAGFAHAGVVGCGLLVMRRGWRRRSWPLWAGLAMQAQVALGILGAQPSTRELEATGMSFAVAALAPWTSLRGQALSDTLAHASAPLVAAILVGLALAVSYVPSALLFALRDRAWRLSLGTALLVVVSSAACAGVLDSNRVSEVLAAPSGDDNATAALVAASNLTPAIAVPIASLAMDRWFEETPAPLPTSIDVVGPSRVEIVGSDNQYQYLVNGQPQVIKGMGMNTQYTSQLSSEDRASRLDADMAAMQALGINTVLGWDPAEFDIVLLDAAQRHGIGVVMPFDLDPEADYTDPQLRQRLHDEVLTWVATYRNHPALRMWGLGNEVLHKIVHPAWVGPQDPRRDRNAQAFSEWLLHTADDIHALDPDHPVTYRSAEDAFVPWIAAAWQRLGNQPRPWFVFGTNCYQDYLAKIVENWPTSGLHTALWVSEFAPGGMAIPDRPDGFSSMWTYVRSHPDYVLGGAVYAWTRNGPEGVDRNFGLTDDGVPVDGRSLDTLSALFHAE